MDDTERDASTAACADVPPHPGVGRRAPYREREVGGARYRALAVDALTVRFAAVDPAVVADENAYRCVAAAESGYGTEC